MNRYFYVPAMDPFVSHEGVSLRDHMKVVDPELYKREIKYFNELCDFAFEDGILRAKRLRNADAHNQKTDKLYRERLLPRFFVLVYRDGTLYELASEVEMDSISLDLLQNFEVLGSSVVDVFIDNPDYTPSARNFFDIYEKNKDRLTEKKDESLKQKVLRRFPFFPGKNS